MMQPSSSKGHSCLYQKLHPVLLSAISYSLGDGVGSILEESIRISGNLINLHVLQCVCGDNGPPLLTLKQYKELKRSPVRGGSGLAGQTTERPFSLDIFP